MKTTLAVTVLTMLSGMLAPADTAEAQSFYRMDRMAYRLQGQTVGLVRELQWAYRETPQYEHLYNDAAAMYKLARHVHQLIHEGADGQHIAADVTKLDGLFHHVQGLVDEMAAGLEADAQKNIDADAPAFFGPGPYGACRGPGCGTGVRALEWRLEAMERTLHYLLEDVKPFIVEPAGDAVPPANDAGPSNNDAELIPLDDVQPQAELQPVADAQAPAAAQ